MRTAPLAALIAVVLAAAALGCSEDEKPCVDCNGDYANALTHPDSLINDLMLSYHERRIEPYAALLAKDFIFHFLPEDAGDIPNAAWDHSQDSTGTYNLFHDVSVTRILVDLQWRAPVPDTLRGEPVQRVDVTFTNLQVDIDGGNTTLWVYGDRQIFYFIPGRESLGEDPGRLYLFDWKDQGNPNGARAPALDPTVESSTWSSIKSRVG